jgi:hypothetical protein
MYMPRKSKVEADLKAMGGASGSCATPCGNMISRR